jgi:hypothetical protein
VTRQRGLDEVLAAWRKQALPASDPALSSSGAEGVARLLQRESGTARRDSSG